MSNEKDAMRSGPGVDRVFGVCSEHGPYELPLGSIDSGEIPRRCPRCAPLSVYGSLPGVPDSAVEPGDWI